LLDGSEEVRQYRHIRKCQKRDAKDEFKNELQAPLPQCGNERQYGAYECREREHQGNEVNTG
jgi:hypothetical protein